MAALNRLTDRQVKAATAGKHNDGGGLWLIKRPDGGAQWIFRFTLHGKRPEMGLGAYPMVSLAQARQQAEQWRGYVLKGINPIQERARQSREGAKGRPTLAAMAVEAFEARKRTLVDDGKASRWEGPLRLHVLPSIGSIPIDELDQRDIQRALEPIWHSKAETARKALARIGIVIQHAMAAGLDVDAQATAKAKALLGAQEDKTKNIDALPWVDVPAFYESLAEPTITHLALRFLILTGLRSKPVRFLHVDHIDGDVLTVPAELMKGTKARKQEFRVPLSKEALAVIELARPFSKDGFLFPSQRRGVISDATMSRYMDRRGMVERPHGFRTSLRTWFAEATDVPQELAKATLSHVDGSKVDRAYRRTDFLDKRRVLLERWADHVTGGTGQVMRLAGNG